MGLDAVRPLVLVGGVLFLAGLMLLATSFLQGPQSAVVTIPQGAPWYYEFRIEVLGPSRIAGEFAELDGRVVDLYVFAAREYRAYELIGLGYNLFSMRGSAGSFQVDLPAGGTYYLVFDHGEGHEETAQTLQVSFRVLGIEPEFFAIGLALAGAGTASLGFGLHARARDQS